MWSGIMKLLMKEEEAIAWFDAMSRAAAQRDEEIEAKVTWRGCYVPTIIFELSLGIWWGEWWELELGVWAE